MTRKELLEQLEKLGVTEVHAAYDGSGDSGGVEDITALDAKAGEVRLGHDLNEAIRDEAHDYLNTMHGGWEINEGSFGTFKLDVINKKRKLEHNERIESTEYSEDEEDFEDDDNGETAADADDNPTVILTAKAEEAVCTCPSLLNGHHAGCPYAAAKRG